MKSKLKASAWVWKLLANIFFIFYLWRGFNVQLINKLRPPNETYYYTLSGGRFVSAFSPHVSAAQVCFIVDLYRRDIDRAVSMETWTQQP
jgi:hypothetical protein